MSKQQGVKSRSMGVTKIWCRIWLWDLSKALLSPRTSASLPVKWA